MVRYVCSRTPSRSSSRKGYDGLRAGKRGLIEAAKLYGVDPAKYQLEAVRAADGGERLVPLANAVGHVSVRP